MTEDAGSKAGELVDDILTDEDGIDVADSTQKEIVNIQGMLLGERRDNGETIDVSPFVLARHAAMLGSTGSGKTVMAKALIEEAPEEFTLRKDFSRIFIFSPIFDFPLNHHVAS